MAELRGNLPECGYDFNLSVASHYEMLEASKLSFNKADNSAFIKIFSKAVTPLNEVLNRDSNVISILTSDDLIIGSSSYYDYYGYNEHEQSNVYDSIYQAKITEMDAKKRISDAKEYLKENNDSIEIEAKKRKR